VCTALHNFFDAIYPISRQFWRDSGLISKVHKKRHVQRAGEAGEQARALGGKARAGLSLI